MISYPWCHYFISSEPYLVATGARKLLLCSSADKSFAFRSDSFVATTVAIENDRKDSVTDSVPIADDRRPVNGNTSGDRLPAPLMSMRPTAVDRISMIGARVASDVEKTDAWRPYGVEAK